MRAALLVELHARLVRFRSLSPERQAEIDRSRFVDTEEMHGLLAYYLANGCCSDERLNSRGHNIKQNPGRAA